MHPAQASGPSYLRDTEIPLKLLYPCAYYSRKLNSAERNYDVGDRELLDMKAAFEEWGHWLEGSTHPFVVLTDHRNLEYLRTAKRLNPRQAHWSLFFSRFNFTVTYRPGLKNTKADALSRQMEDNSPIQPPETIIPSRLIVAPIQWDIFTEVEQANAQSEIPQECPPDKTFVNPQFRGRLLKIDPESPILRTPGYYSHHPSSTKPVLVAYSTHGCNPVHHALSSL